LKRLAKVAETATGGASGGAASNGKAAETNGKASGNGKAATGGAAKKKGGDKKFPGGASVGDELSTRTGDTSLKIKGEKKDANEFSDIDIYLDPEQAGAKNKATFGHVDIWVSDDFQKTYSRIFGEKNEEVEINADLQEGLKKNDIVTVELTRKGSDLSMNAIMKVSDFRNLKNKLSKAPAKAPAKGDKKKEEAPKNVISFEKGVKELGQEVPGKEAEKPAKKAAEG